LRALKATPVEWEDAPRRLFLFLKRRLTGLMPGEGATRAPLIAKLVASKTMLEGLLKA
jgi:hypothetical protein